MDSGFGFGFGFDMRLNLGSYGSSSDSRLGTLTALARPVAGVSFSTAALGPAAGFGCTLSLTT